MIYGCEVLYEGLQQQPIQGRHCLYRGIFYAFRQKAVVFHGNIISRYVLYIRYYSAINSGNFNSHRQFLTALNLPSFELIPLTPPFKRFWHRIQIQLIFNFYVTSNEV